MASNGNGDTTKTKHNKQPSNAGRVLDGSRKQNASPVDPVSRKQPGSATKAWQGPNPITSRSNNNTPPLAANGVERSNKANTRVNGDSNTDKHAHDRLLFLVGNMIGYDAILSLKNGEQFTGILAGGVFEASKSYYTLEMVKRIRHAGSQQSNGVADVPEEYAGEGENHVQHFDLQDTVDLAVSDVSLSSRTSQNGTASTFRTDTEISGRAPAATRERELQRWEPGPSDTSLDDLTFGESGTNGWDQFAANEQKYGVQTTYDEDIYTTSIDKSHPQYKRRLAEADRLAREIEGSAAPNAHMAEERQKDIHQDDDGDEEDKYSGVRRDITPLAKGGSGSYVPPSRRPITAAPTVPGAPFDPAIISSQVARRTPVADEKPVDSKPAEQAAQIGKTPSPIPSAKVSPGTTEDRVRDTADAFKLFANTEKMRLRQAQEMKRTNARNEKNVRINDLKKFAENFKLKSRVPDDLVPILAKDHDKQVEIKRKAEEAARLEEQRGKEVTTPTNASASSTTQADRSALPAKQRLPQSRSQFVPQLTPGMSPRQAQLFNSKPLPRQSLPAQSSQPNNLSAQSEVPTVPAAAKKDIASPTVPGKLSFNAKAFEFKPAASVFTPSGSSPSPARTMPPTAPVAIFDDDEKKLIAARERTTDEQDVNVIAYLLEEGKMVPEEAKKAVASNGGVPQPYRTPPTWSVPTDRQNTTYEDMFPKTMSNHRSPLHTPNGMGQQMPPNMSTVSTPQRYYAPQGMPHPYTQFDPRMQGVPGASVQSSPRFQQAQIPFGAQLGQMPQMHMQQFPGQQMPIYGMSPNMSHRPLQMPQGQPVVMAQGYGPGTPMRQPYGQTGQYPGMIPQGPGGYQQGYSPMAQNVQPHMLHMQPGFAGSPRPGPHMMQHAGSHQGFQPHHMMQQYPAQQNPYAMNQRQMSAGQFQQATPRQTQANLATGQPLPSPGANGQATAQSQGEDGK